MKNKFGALAGLADPRDPSVAGTKNTGTDSKEDDVDVLGHLVAYPGYKTIEDSESENRNGKENDLGVLNDLADPGNNKDFRGAEGVEEKGDQFGLISSSVSTSDRRTGLASETNGSNTAADQPQQDDEPSEPGDVPESVEIKLAGSDLRGKAEPDKYDSDTSQFGKNSFPGENEDPEGDTDRPYGNPPVLSDSDLLNLAKKIPDDLSPEEREQLRQKISDSLGLSALGPGLAMLPPGASSTTPAQVEENSTTSTLALSKQSYTTSTSTQSSTVTQGKSSDKKNNSLLNIIGNIVQSDSTEQLPATGGKADEHLNDGDINNNHDNNVDFENNESEGNEQGENYGRKVLNENDGDSHDTAADDDDDLEDDKIAYDEYDDKDYIGGDVLMPTSTTPTRIPFGAGDENIDHASNSKDVEELENKWESLGKLRCGILPGTNACVGCK